MPSLEAGGGVMAKAKVVVVKKRSTVQGPYIENPAAGRHSPRATRKGHADAIVFK